MPNTTQQIIKEAKERGFIPEKKVEYSEAGMWQLAEVNREEYAYKNIGFNQAIDSFQLEKIIELAYERGKKDLINEIVHEERKFVDGDNHPKNCNECLLTNLPNKEI